MTREYKKNQVLHDTKGILFDAFIFLEPNENKSTIKKLVTIVDKIKDEDLDSNVKSLAWLERQFHTNVLEKISSAIKLRHVDQETKMESLKTMLDKIFSLYTKLCNVELFTQEAQRAID